MLLNHLKPTLRRRGWQSFECPTADILNCLAVWMDSFRFDVCGLGRRRSAIGRFARVSTALSPVNVISPIEGDDHQARGVALAGELMRHVASHHGKPAWPEP